MSNELDNMGWGVAAVVTTLLGAVGTLYKKVEGQNAAAIAEVKTQVADLKDALKQSNDKHDECLQDRDKLRIEMATLQLQMSALECKSCKRGDA